jgi:hypothetical protein
VRHIDDGVASRNGGCENPWVLLGWGAMSHPWRSHVSAAVVDNGSSIARDRAEGQGQEGALVKEEDGDEVEGLTREKMRAALHCGLLR